MRLRGLILWTLIAAGPDSLGHGARRIVEAATRAVRGDTAAPLVVRLGATLRRDPTDRYSALGLATVGRLTFDYATADRLYGTLTPSQGPTTDAAGTYARLGEAQALLARGRVLEAEAWYVRAADDARHTVDSSALATALIGVASTRVRTRGPAAAGRALAGVDRMIAADDGALQASYRCTQALLRMTAGGTGVRAAAAAGAALARRATDVSAEAKCLYVEMNDAVRMNDMTSAVAISDTMERLIARVHDRAGLAVIRQWRGYAQVEQGDFGAAAKTLRAALADAEAAQHEPAAGAIAVNLAEVYFGLGDVATAAQYVAISERRLRAAGDAWGPVTLLGFRAAIALAVGDTAAARTAYVTQITAARATSNLTAIVEAQTGLADVATREGNLPLAEAALDSVRVTQRRFHATGWQSSTAFALATVALRDGRFPDADRLAERYRRALRPAQHGERYLVGARLAEIHLHQGDTLRAERELGNASDEIDAWRATLDEPELRTLAFQVANHFGGLDPGVAVVIAGAVRAGHIGSAFALAERRRARDLGDELRRMAAVPSATRQDRADIVGTVQRALPDDSTAILEYVTGRGDAPTTLFAITRRGARAYVLPPVESLAEPVTRFVTLVESGRDAPASAQTLGATLLGPAFADLGPEVTRLVVVPDGALYRVPFAALRLLDGRSVVERAAVSTTPSALVAADLWSRTTDARPVVLLAFGDAHMPRETDIVRDPDGEVVRAAFDASGGLPRLRASADEARLAARFASRAVVRLRDDASESYLKRVALDSFRIIHFATHAIVDDQAVTRTALALAPDSANDGFVSVSDLTALRLHADLVVVSACRASGGVVVGGEGVRGLTAPLLAAGARAVLASQWEIGDRATVGTMAAFYRGLADHLPATKALRRAQLAALHAGVAPRQWAAFVLVGDPTVRVPLRVPPFEWLRDWLRARLP